MFDALLPMLVPLLAAASEKSPEPEDVKAGYVALLIFVLLIVAVALLGWSLTRELRKAQSSKDAGIYGDEPAPADDRAGTDELTDTDEPKRPEA